MASIDKRVNAQGKVTSYRVRWRLGGTRDGSWQTATFKRRRGEGSAEEFKAKVEAAGHQWPDDTTGLQSIPADVDGITVDQLAERYFAYIEPRVKSDRTVKDYRRDYATWIKPTFGTMRADDVDDGHVQDWVDEIDRAPKTVAGFHALLSAMYVWGARPSRRLVTGNPCAGTDLPERRRGVPKGLRAGEWALLYQAACDTDQDAADFLLFLVGTGWRWSEATALQVMHVDLKRRDPVVQMGQVRRRTASNGVQLVVDQGKSDAALRSVKVSPKVAAMLRRRINGAQLGDYVFATPTGRPLHYGNFRTRKWLPILERARALGLTKTPTLHGLRHTQVGLLIEAGANLPAIQRRIGHESITTTVDVYGRMVDDVPIEVLDALDGALFGRQTLRVVNAEA